MRPDLQQQFLEEFEPARFERFLHTLEQRIGMHIEFRVCECPIFMSHAFRGTLERAATEILLECVSPAMRRESEHTLEDRYRVPGDEGHPLFAVLDFAVTQTPDGEYRPKLIEMQGFPSLFGYQLLYGQTARDVYELDPALATTLGGLSEEDYIRRLREAILGGHDPDQVALLEFAPQEQKTRPDFLALRGLIGIEETDIRSVRKEGKTLLHERGGRWVPIKRIFNRAIIDELDEHKAALAFHWGDELDVEWAGHPNWYFRISKFLLPFLEHAAVPRTWRLDRMDQMPADLENFVLKPLYSFAGKGVNVSPTRNDVERARAEQAANYILQEKVDYKPCVITPEGLNKIEIRIMLIWPADAAGPTPVMSLIRTGRGPMMGVRYNNVPWSGSSTGLFI